MTWACTHTHICTLSCTHSVSPSEDDYDFDNSIFKFDGCDIPSCVNITIIDDMKAEPKTTILRDTFHVALNSSDPPNNIVLSTETTKVYIRDDDGTFSSKFVGSYWATDMYIRMSCACCSCNCKAWLHIIYYLWVSEFIHVSCLATSKQISCIHVSCLATMFSIHHCRVHAVLWTHYNYYVSMLVRYP